MSRINKGQRFILRPIRIAGCAKIITTNDNFEKLKELALQLVINDKSSSVVGFIILERDGSGTEIIKLQLFKENDANSKRKIRIKRI